MLFPETLSTLSAPPVPEASLQAAWYDRDSSRHEERGDLPPTHILSKPPAARGGQPPKGLRSSPRYHAHATAPSTTRSARYQPQGVRRSA